MSPQRLAVIGATGNLGRAVMSHATKRGMEVTAISRTISAGHFGPSVRCIACSGADIQALTTALQGIDVIAMVFPASLQEPAAYPGQIAAMFEAARRAGVRRIVGLIGSAGALTPHGQRLYETDYFEETTRHFYASVSHAWDVFRSETAPDWVAFVPAARMQTHMADRGAYRVRTDEQLVVTDEQSWRYFDTSQISYGDLALAMVDEIEHPSRSRVFLTVGY